MCNQLWSNHTYLINLLFSYIPLFFIIFIIVFYHYHHYSHFAAKSGTYLFMTLVCCSEMCFHSFTSFNILVLCCFIPLGSTDCLVCNTAFGMQHTKFWGVCESGDFWVIFRSPRITYYTGNTFGFNVNISYLYSVKPQIIIL